LFRPAESFFRIQHQDFVGKKFGFCSGDAAISQKIQNRPKKEKCKEQAEGGAEVLCVGRVVSARPHGKKLVL